MSTSIVAIAQPKTFIAMAVCAVRWVPVSFRTALLVLALQVTAVAIPIVTIVVLESPP